MGTTHSCAYAVISGGDDHEASETVETVALEYRLVNCNFSFHVI